MPNQVLLALYLETPALNSSQSYGTFVTVQILSHTIMNL